MVNCTPWHTLPREIQDSLTEGLTEVFSEVMVETTVIRDFLIGIQQRKEYSGWVTYERTLFLFKAFIAVMHFLNTCFAKLMWLNLNYFIQKNWNMKYNKSRLLNTLHLICKFRIFISGHIKRYDAPKDNIFQKNSKCSFQPTRCVPKTWTAKMGISSVMVKTSVSTSSHEMSRAPTRPDAETPRSTRAVRRTRAYWEQTYTWTR